MPAAASTATSLDTRLIIRLLLFPTGTPDIPDAHHTTLHNTNRPKQNHPHNPTGRKPMHGRTAPRPRRESGPLMPQNCQVESRQQPKTYAQATTPAPAHRFRTVRRTEPANRTPRDSRKPIHEQLHPHPRRGLRPPSNPNPPNPTTQPAKTHARAALTPRPRKDSRPSEHENRMAGMQKAQAFRSGLWLKRCEPAASTISRIHQSADSLMYAAMFTASTVT